MVLTSWSDTVQSCLFLTASYVCSRYGLVRVRENAESIAFYGGEASEQGLLWQRLSAVIKNYAQLLSTSRNLEFFTSSYRQANLTDA